MASSRNKDNAVGLPNGHNRSWDAVKSNDALCPKAEPPPPPPPTRADEYSVDELIALADSDTSKLKNFDFYGVSDEVLAKLAPKIFQSGKKTSIWIAPPDPFRTSYKLLRQWGRMSLQQKEQERERSQSRQSQQSVGRPLKRRRTERQPLASVAANDSRNNTGTSQPLPESSSRPNSRQAPRSTARYSEGQTVYYTFQNYSGFVKILKVHLDDELVPYYTIGIGDREKQTDNAHLSAKSPEQQDAQRQAEDMLMDMDDERLLDTVNFMRNLQTPACQGLTCEYLEMKTSEPQQLEKGFRRVAADAQHRGATATAHDQDWPLDPIKYVGCIDAYGSNDAEKQVRMLLRVRDDCSSDDTCRRHRHYGFVSTECSGQQSADGKPCVQCLSQERYLRRKCLDSAGWESDPTEINRKKLENIESPTKLREECVGRTELNQKRQRQNERKLAQERKKIRLKTPSDLSAGYKKFLGIEHISELFNNKDLEKMWQDVLEGETVEKKDLANGLWEESRYQANVAKKSGKQACRYSDVMFHMAIQMKIKLGNGRYDFASRALPGLPGLRQVQAKMAAQSTASDVVNGGILDASLLDMRDQFHQKHGKNVPMTDRRRHVAGGFDTTSVVQGLEISTTTKEVVGLAYDCEQGMNLFKAAISSLADVFEDDDNGDDDNNDDIDVDDSNTNDKTNEKTDADADTAEHFFVFIATTLDANNDRISRTVARFALKSVSSDFLKRYLDTITSALCVYGFVLVSMGMDGAVENRTWAKWKVTHSIEDLEKLGVCPRDLIDDPFIPSKKQLAYLHPCFDPGEKMFIVIHPDLAHLIKKLVNALEMSSSPESKRNLKFRGRKLSLEMVRVVWEHSTSPGQVRTTRLSVDHFDKNPNSRMRAYLSFQVTSNSTVVMIFDFFGRDGEEEEDESDSDSDSDPGSDTDSIDSEIEQKDAGNGLSFDDYKTLCEFLLLGDVTIDVMNSRQKGHDGIDSPDHPDVEELLKFVRFAEKWRQEVNADDSLDGDNFLPMSTYEDLCWMCLGTYVLAHRYLSHDKSFRYDLGCCGSDCCEHRFGTLKGRYTHRLTVANGNQGCALADNMNASAFNMKACGNASGAPISTSHFRNRKK